MTRLAKLFIFFATFYSAMADADVYYVNATFATGPDQPTRIVLINKYCMSEENDAIDVVAGRAVIYLETDGNPFSKCGWVHSSATYEVQNDKKEKKLEFELYQPVDRPAHLSILWPPHANCDVTEKVDLLCGIL